MSGPEETLLIGKIVGVHGMKGYLKVFSFDGSMDLFGPGRQLRVHRGGKEQRRLTIGNVQPYKNLLRIAFTEIADRTAAEALTGADLAVHRDALPELEDGKWYWCDLIGLSVFGIDGTLLGLVENLFETGSNDVLVVKQAGEEILIPMIESVVCDVDLEQRKIIVDLPDGLL